MVGDLSNLRNIFQFRDSTQLSILGNLSSLENIFNSKIRIKFSIFRDLLLVYMDWGGGFIFSIFPLVIPIPNPLDIGGSLRIQKRVSFIFK